MFKSRQIRPASGEVALLLSTSAIAHYRRGTAPSKSRGDVAWATKVPQDHACFQLLVPLEVRPEKGFLLSGYQRGSHEMPRQEQRPSISSDGGQIVQIIAGTVQRERRRGRRGVMLKGWSLEYNVGRLFTEVLSVSQYGPSEIIETSRAEDDPTMAEGRPHRHGDDLANVDYMKRYRFWTVYLNGERNSPVTSRRSVK